jgi:hypothetical protein
MIVFKETDWQLAEKFWKYAGAVPDWEGNNMTDTFEIMAMIPSRPSLLMRVIAWMRAAKLDKEAGAGVIPVPGSPLAAHIARLESVQEREDVARCFLRLLQAGRPDPTLPPVLISVLTERLDESRDVIYDITLRLHSPRPVQAQGVARLRTLLSDGAGPLYVKGQEDLDYELRHALAAL